MTIQFRSARTASHAGAGTFTNPALPFAVVGDTMIAVLVVDNSGASTGFDPGWVVIDTVTFGTAIAYLLAAPLTASTVSTWGGTGNHASVAVAAYRGALSVTGASHQANAASLRWDCPPNTLSQAGQWLICAAGGDTGATDVLVAATTVTVRTPGPTKAVIADTVPSVTGPTGARALFVDGVFPSATFTAVLTPVIRTAVVRSRVGTAFPLVSRIGARVRAGHAAALASRQPRVRTGRAYPLVAHAHRSRTTSPVVTIITFTAVAHRTRGGEVTPHVRKVTSGTAHRTRRGYAVGIKS